MVKNLVITGCAICLHEQVTREESCKQYSNKVMGILLMQERLSYLFVILTACDRWPWSKASNEGQVSHRSHGTRSHVALWVLQQVFCEPQHLWGQQTLPELILVCKQDRIQRSGSLFPLSMKLYQCKQSSYKDGHCLQGQLLEREATARTRQMFCVRLPLSQQLLVKPWQTLELGQLHLELLQQQEKTFYGQVGTWFQPHQIHAFA